MLLAELHVTGKNGQMEHLGYIRILNSTPGDDPATYTIRRDTYDGVEAASVENFDRARGAWQLLIEALQILEDRS